MALTLAITHNYTIAGRTYAQSTTQSGSLVINGEPDVLKAQAGTVTSGGTTTAGNLTLTTGHGITTGQVVDLYWTGGRLIGCTIGTVSGNTVPVTATGTYEDGASALPANASAIYVAPRITDSAGFVGNSLQGIVCNFAGLAANIGTFAFWNGSSLLFEVSVLGGNTWEWDTQNGYDNPFAGVTVTSITYSHNETDQATVPMKLGALIL